MKSKINSRMRDSAPGDSSHDALRAFHRCIFVFRRVGGVLQFRVNLMCY